MVLSEPRRLLSACFKDLLGPSCWPLEAFITKYTKTTNSMHFAEHISGSNRQNKQVRIKVNSELKKSKILKNNI